MTEGPVIYIYGKYMPSINLNFSKTFECQCDSSLLCFSHVTHEVTEDFSPWDPRTVVVKEDGRGCTSSLPLPELEREEEKEDISDSMDINPCSATYSNLGKCKCHISGV